MSRVYAVLTDELSKRLGVLTDEVDSVKELVERQRDTLKGLMSEKVFEMQDEANARLPGVSRVLTIRSLVWQEKLRAERIDQKQRDEEQRRAEIRQKTVARTAKLRVKKKSPQRRVQGAGSDDPHNAGDDSRRLPEHDALDEAREIAHVVESALPPIEFVRSHQDQLDQKRHDAILRRECLREELARAAADAARELNRRREESLLMRAADELASALERLSRKKERLRALKLRLARIASIPVFACVQQLSGKKLRVAIYEQRARGYILDGLRVVAYDPTSSSSFPLVMTTREYRSLGYGRTAEGFGAFCKWLCLLYEKRKRHFRLIWSGPPCPPPLRVREYDSVLCVHKEGMRLRTADESFGFFLVAAYVRPDASTKLHFVLSDLRSGKDSACHERVVDASRLMHSNALEVQYAGSDKDDAFVVWRHQRADATQRQQDQRRFDETRIYSGEVRIRTRSVLVHVFDASPTEFVLELHPREKTTRAAISQAHRTPSDERLPTQVTLMKNEVNPYDVHLPPSAFGDLVAAVDFSDDGEPTVTAKWLHKLTKYVRVLRLTKFGCQIDSKWFLATLSIVQLKTEFRSYVLLELASVSDPTIRKQTVRISLSEYLRCAHGARQALPLEDAAVIGCHSCDDEPLPHADNHSDFVTHLEFPNTECPSCIAIQDTRLRGVRELVTVSGTHTATVTPIDYHGHCQLCGAFAKPVLVAMSSSTTAAAAGLVQRLGYHFSCFNMTNCSDSDGSARRDGEAVDELRQAVEVERIVVLYNADCGATATAATDFTHDLRWKLYPEHHEPPFDVVFVVDTRALNGDQLGAAIAVQPRDQDVVEALEALNVAADHIASQAPIRDDNEPGHADALSFEAYLVSEALLVEATRVVLQPELPWRTPGETVGASSWSAACEFLANPSALRAKLRRVTPSSLLLPATQETLDAYFRHAKWPREYDGVRPVFHALLCYMLNASHLREILRSRGGMLNASSSLETGAAGAKMSVIALDREALES